MPVPTFTEGADTYGGGGADEYLDVLGGNDTIDGGGGNDTILGGNGSDSLHGGEGNDSIDAGSGLNLVFQYVYGDGGNDTLLATGGIYVDFYGGEGDDVITGALFGNVEGGVGADTLTGTGGFVGSVLSYLQSASAVTINLGTGAASGGDATGDVFFNFSNVVGSTHGDRLTGSSGTNSIEGFWGNDTLLGLGGNDYMRGGDGDDSIDGGADDDFIYGDDGADTIIGGTGIDMLSYAETSVGVTVNLAANTASGGAAAGDTFSGIENLAGSTGDDSLTANSGNNSLDGGTGSDTLRGGSGNDTLSAGDSQYSPTVYSNKLYGEDGDDLLNAGKGTDLMSGGDGIDTVQFNAVASALNLATGVGTAGDAAGDTYSSIENVIGSSQNDTITGSDAANRLQGEAGSDSLDGGEGNDTLDGGTGNDTLKGGGGNDTVTYETSFAAVTVNLLTLAVAGAAAGDVLNSIENVFGGWGADSLTGNAAANVLRGGSGKDTMDGGAGKDTADYSNSFGSIELTLKGATLSDVKVFGSVEDSIRNFENASGGSGYDKLTGDGTANVLKGNSGDDTLKGAGGNDTLDGGTGLDVADYSDKTKQVVVTLNKSTAVTVKVNGVAEDSIKNIENVFGGSVADKLTGDSLANRFIGNGGADTMDGGTGIDTADYLASTKKIEVTLNTSTFATVKINGVAEDKIKNIENVFGGLAADKLTGDGLANFLLGFNGNDTLSGGNGNDTLNGGTGKDSLTGGSGKDYFVFDLAPSAASVDTIVSFSSADDTIQIENYYFTGITATGTLASAAFRSNTTGLAEDSDDRIIYDKSTGKLFYDVDGLNGTAAVQFAVLNTKPTIGHTDFVIV